MINDETKQTEQNENSTTENKEASAETERSLEEQMNALKEEAAQYKDHWMRAVADADNVRKRADRERQDTIKYAITNFARDVLSISDNLSRALEMIPTEEKSEALKAMENGIRMVEKELLDIFNKHGIKKIDPKHEKFDPNFHQAMFEVPTNDHAPGTVVEVMQVGYALHDRLLKPAMVGVAKSPAAQEKAG